MLNKIKNYLNISMIFSIIFIVFGIFCVCKPNTSFELISCICGIIFIVSGISFIILNHKTHALFINYLLHGILAIIIGIIIIIDPEPLKTIFPILIAIYFIASGLANFRLSLYLKEESLPLTLIAITMSLLSIICGFVLILKPLESLNILIITIGITIIIQNVSNIIDTYIIKKHLNTIIKKIKFYVSEFTE